MERYREQKGNNPLFHYPERTSMQMFWQMFSRLYIHTHTYSHTRASMHTCTRSPPMHARTHILVYLVWAPGLCSTSPYTYSCPPSSPPPRSRLLIPCGCRGGDPDPIRARESSRTLLARDLEMRGYGFEVRCGGAPSIM